MLYRITKYYDEFNLILKLNMKKTKCSESPTHEMEIETETGKETDTEM